MSSNFSQSIKYQDDVDYGRSSYSPRHSTRTPFAKSSNKQTNTPPEFMICPRCQEKLSKKNQTYASYCAVGDCDRNVSEYTKALNYINSCHVIINQMMANQNKDGSEFVKMPELPNFLGLYTTLPNYNLLSGDFSKISNKSLHESRHSNQLLDGRTKSNFKDKNRSLSPKLPQNKQQKRDDQVKQTTKGRFIELLPDVKQENNYKDNISPGTTESEESDVEMNILQNTGRAMASNKFKSKIIPTHEKVIYEEGSVEDDSTIVSKKQEELCQKNKKQNINRIPSSAERARSIQNSPTASQKTKTFNNNSPNAVVCNTAITNDNISKKIKQRSSSIATPREKPKLINNNKGLPQEVTGNFSDTAIMPGSCIVPTKKFGQKTLSTPINLGNKELTQQELDKYAKELLGSESASPRSKSPVRSPFGNSPTCTKPKSDQEKNKKKSPPTPTVRLRAIDVKRRLHQEKQNAMVSLNASSSKISATISSNQQQNQEQQMQHNHQDQLKKCKKVYNIQQQHQQQQSQQQQQQQIDQAKRQNTNCRDANSKNANFAFGNVIPQTAYEPNYVRLRHETSNGAQNQVEENVTTRRRCDNIDDGNCSSPEQLNLLPSNTEPSNAQSTKRSPAKKGKTQLEINVIPQVQYYIKTKPMDMFTRRRKGDKNKFADTNFVEEEDEDDEEDVEAEEDADADNTNNIESDEIKTDSDIEDSHFEKGDVDHQSDQSSTCKVDKKREMSKVLCQLGLLPNSNVFPEAEQMIEAKSTRANDERNRPFREPRKSTNDNPNEAIIKIEDARMREVYATESLTQLHRTISEESSDIKSDEEVYNPESRQKKQVPFNYCLDNDRY